MGSHVLLTSFPHYTTRRLSVRARLIAVVPPKKMLYTQGVSPVKLKGESNMAWPHKNRPRKGRRKIGSGKRKARAARRKKS